ncbi:Rhodanese-like domain [Metamycoplasma arthritidis]|uniref:Rhodanese-like domain protein n=1 Tax=Metamycoplasma arthritidis (strain 158L3-1) TaxID=243272 RepID=B3PM97_META1|nr:rhodanese-like domain-containing protein [Metamycoplasma arthritidis]ACF07149.1 rhodanese-like domain protein [Metamycoplasma arthritidis 158L3-1]VEU78674.1 Rhodanese-like domain [Metamycoplasma arthritidis]
MKKRLVFISILSSLTLLSSTSLLALSCENKISQTFSPKKLTTQEAAEMILKEKNNSNFVLMDIRTPGEWAEGYLKGAQKLDFRNENFSNELDKLDKNKTYLIYCRTDNRAQKAVELMRQKGFRHVYWMEQGYTKWSKEGREVYRPVEKENVYDLEISATKNTFKATSDLKITSKVNNLGYGKALETYNLSLELIDEKGSVLATKTLTNQQNGSEFNFESVFDSNLINQSGSIYTIKASLVIDNKVVANGIYKFKISNNATQLTKEDYRKNGAFDHFSDSKYDELNNEFLNENFGKNLLKYTVTNNKGEQKQLTDLIDKKKKTLALFATTTCLPCLEALKKLNNVDLDKFNYLKMMTSIDENDINGSIKKSEEVFDSENLKDQKDSTYYDANDFIWRDRMRFRTTPKLALLDEYGNVVNISEIDTSSDGAFIKSLKKIIKNTFNEDVDYKQNDDPQEKLQPDPSNPGNSNQDSKPKQDQESPDASKPDPKPNPEPDDPNLKNLTEYRTYEQRKKLHTLYQYDSDGHLKELYAKNLGHLVLRKSNGETITLKELLKDNDKPIALIYGATYCSHCMKAMRKYSNQDPSSLPYRLVYVMYHRGSNSSWNAVTQANGFDESKDKYLFRTGDWEIGKLANRVKAIPKVFILDKKMNVSDFLFSHTAMIDSWVEKIGNFLATNDESLTHKKD